MGIRVALHHRTSYRYDRYVTLGAQTVRLRPAPHSRTPIRSYSLKVTPADHFINWQQDPQGNFLARLVFLKPTRELNFFVDLIADLSVINPFDFFLEPEAEAFPFSYAASLSHELQPYLTTEPVGPRMQVFLNDIPRQKKRTIDFLVDLNQRVHHKLAYVIRMEPGVQTSEESLERRSGSCRDSAWLLVQALRNVGLAARFVSGYLIQLKPDVKSLDGPVGAGEDFTDLHAWAEVYLPGAGWVGLDPTSGLFTGEGHIPLAATPDPASAAPLSGGVDFCEQDFDFHMSITRVHEEPRVTKPYTEEQWSRVESLGSVVDRALSAADVRLTMGGEPTFVSMDDMESEQWSTAALGPEKRLLSGKLFRRLANRFAVNPLLHFGQGKWYPGEQLPRWALGCYWRTDGNACWDDPQWTAADDADYGHDSETARTFITALAERLSVKSEHAIAAYEDAFYYLWKERRLPVNVDPLKSPMGDREERARLAKVFEQGLTQVVGYALPLRAQGIEQGRSRWASGEWTFKTEQMFLLPGDSPMGFRLPLDSIPWSAQKNEFIDAPLDPFSPREPLPSRTTQIEARGSNGAPHFFAARAVTSTPQRVMQIAGMGHTGTSWGNGSLDAHDNGHGRNTADDPLSPPPDTLPDPIVRTAICVEARKGVLHIFMPPVPRIENYLDLVADIEATAQSLGTPVRIEGYSPPADSRIKHFKITPDPGVIEVNLQPASNWDEIVDYTRTLYEEARETRLSTEKFMLDGRHTGTGGGNHIVLGGATPEDSPFLRRPDLLKSFLTYWNNRPSLSYLFSGLFVGPCSQAPRVDEARHESLYELETAFNQLHSDSQPTPWLVDRVLRHLLVDMTGNTHRAEFCIDKLFSPDSSAGRLGLIEFRGFEMPPHWQMSLTQQLLIRALVARFWKKPYEQELVRWGTTLHDRYLLPHFVAQDFAEVITELKDAGFAFEQEWFAAHFEFRFPLLGGIAKDGIELELRQAIEPWHVLGEEPGAGGTARYVDSSVERVQIKLRGLTDTRHIVTCNGRRVPLHPTGTHGEFVAGIRFRAWQPPSCLHPTIGVHSPLTFDIVDTWNERSLGGCTWNVVHPGGLSFDTFPVNSYAAESRRMARFFPIGHTGGRIVTPTEECNCDYPLTLDLRRPVSPAALA